MTTALTPPLTGDEAGDLFGWPDSESSATAADQPLVLCGRPPRNAPPRRLAKPIAAPAGNYYCHHYY